MLEILYLHQSSKFKIYMTFFSADNLDLIVESIGTTWRQKKDIGSRFSESGFPFNYDDLGAIYDKHVVVLLRL